MYVYIMHCDMQSELMRYMPPSTYRTPERQHPKGEHVENNQRKPVSVQDCQRMLFRTILRVFKMKRPFYGVTIMTTFQKLLLAVMSTNQLPCISNTMDALKNPTMEPTQSTNQSHLHLPFVARIQHCRGQTSRSKEVPSSGKCRTISKRECVYI